MVVANKAEGVPPCPRSRDTESRVRRVGEGVGTSPFAVFIHSSKLQKLQKESFQLLLHPVELDTHHPSPGGGQLSFKHPVDNIILLHCQPICARPGGIIRVMSDFGNEDPIWSCCPLRRWKRSLITPCARRPVSEVRVKIRDFLDFSRFFDPLPASDCRGPTNNKFIKKTQYRPSMGHVAL